MAKAKLRAGAEGVGGEAGAVVPAGLGYAMPAEWGPREGTWMAWPHHRVDWRGKFEPMPWVFAEIVRVLAEGERVDLMVQPSAGGVVRKRVEDVLGRANVRMGNVVLHERGTDRAWVRDSGGIVVTKKLEARSQKPEDGSRKTEEGRAICDFKFNGWARYGDSGRDDRVAGFMAEVMGVERFVAYGENDAGEMQRFVLEGGSVDVNGGGCVLTTEECLLSKVQQRNPGFSRGRIERVLCDWLGVKKVLWLGAGIAGDDTHGHVDDIARFVGEGRIAACVEGNRGDVNYGALRDNLRRLGKMRDCGGRSFEVVELPMPGAVVFEGQRLPASYANFYIAKAGVVVPVFNDRNDGRALKLLEGCFPGRAILPVYCRDLVWGKGTVHCVTQQVPGEG